MCKSLIVSDGVVLIEDDLFSSFGEIIEVGFERFII